MEWTHPYYYPAREEVMEWLTYRKKTTIGLQSLSRLMSHLMARVINHVPTVIKSQTLSLCCIMYYLRIMLIYQNIPSLSYCRIHRNSTFLVDLLGLLNRCLITLYIIGVLYHLFFRFHYHCYYCVVVINFPLSLFFILCSRAPSGLSWLNFNFNFKVSHHFIYH